jgi:GNAT superfamily N-acetyltransferase
MDTDISIVDATPDQTVDLGRILADVYARLDGFPGPREQPGYYAQLRNVGALAARPGTRVLVATAPDTGEVLGGIVYFSDLGSYGAGCVTPWIGMAAGVRFLGVSPQQGGRGIGRRLTLACIDAARRDGRLQMLLHTTAAMRQAWRMYEQLGFARCQSLDFVQLGMPVFGFTRTLGLMPMPVEGASGCGVRGAG